MSKLIPLTQGQNALVDDDVYEWASQYKWCFMRVYRHYGYAARAGTNPKRTIYLHREIARPVDGLVIDHINGDTLDCRRENLRLCTTKQNFRNAHPHRTGKLSPFKGIAKVGKKWQASITVDGKGVYLKRHATQEQAARAYDRAALKYFGDFARTNFPREEYENV